ncbi:hypothetical protein QYF61_014996 [Mycteria americana]|uniref:Uncharacterized protein n=1 Tax=Mycteria americana TaxID=33587 RepID=A0AAN7MYN3_MYCAM|nr:hypothetical protein QYF61_014996 [Mycteria americana]
MGERIGRVKHIYLSSQHGVIRKLGKEKVSGPGDKTIETTATPAPRCDRYCGYSRPRIVPGNEPVEDEKAGPSQRDKEEELMDEKEIIRSLSLSELQGMRKDFSCCPGEHVVTQLLQYWDSGAGSLELEGKEAKQLRSSSREGGIDKVIGKGAQVLSLWR